MRAFSFLLSLAALNSVVFLRSSSFLLGNARLRKAFVSRLSNNDEFLNKNILQDILGNQFPRLSRREIMVSFGPVLSVTLAPGRTMASPPPTNAAQEYSVLNLKPQKAPFSTSRQYKGMTLANGMRVLLVSDRQAIRSQAALSIAGAGQFSDPPELRGCAHLMEHMVLSSSDSYSALRKSTQNFEEWLEDVEGASNAFTGYEQVLFHFTSPPLATQEALTRFAKLFNEPDVFRICQNEEVLRREVRRAASELDADDEAMQVFYLLKEIVNPKHPYSWYSRGSIDSMEQIPKEAGISTGKRLFQFYRELYQPSRAVLVVVAPYDISTLERWVAPFSFSLSREIGPSPFPRRFPKAFTPSNKSRQLLLYRAKNDYPPRKNVETMSMHWVLELDYNGKNPVTATQVGFVLSQILGRRGPGSLYYILYRRKWVPPGLQGLPRITFPVDVSGFQLMKLDIVLTLEGFANRASVVSDVYRSINSVFSGAPTNRFLVSRQILTQYAVVAELHGYVLAARAPDAIEIANDCQLDPEGRNIVNPQKWTRFASPNDRSGLFALQKTVKETLAKMSDQNNAVVITTASDNAINKAKERIAIGESVPFVYPRKWPSASITGAKYFRDDLLILPGLVGDIFIGKREEDELLPPLTNVLIPPVRRPPRLSQQVIDVNEGRSKNWRILEARINTFRLRIPRMAPEPSPRASFVFQLLSPRPARANTRQAAFAELWKSSFEKAVVDLAELGAPAGLAYDLSFNRFGMRICFLGISQNLASYARRFCRRLVQHHKDLLDGQELIDSSITETASYELQRQRMSVIRKREIERIIKEATAYEVATEVCLKCCLDFVLRSWHFG